MQRKILTLIIVLTVIVFTIVALETQKPEVSKQEIEEVAVMSKEEKAERYESAKEISSPDAFINTPDITIGEQVGNKVVLVDFWTYSCINCQRTTPYLNDWYEKYSDKGLVIIGIHTPEFEFEKELENVKQAVEKFDIKYPVVLDNDYSTWRAYNNRYWPRKYLIDIDGYIVYDHIGEGAYQETEKKIQEALAERNTRLGVSNGVDMNFSQFEEGERRVGTPEIYFGSSRNNTLGNGAKGVAGVQNLNLPGDLKENALYLGGTWLFTSEYAENQGEEDIIVLEYNAKDVYMVASASGEVEVEVWVDNKFSKKLSIKEEELYILVEGNKYDKHLLKLIIKKPGLKAFTFTFG
jgi:thiol-disulfide isomerase/thioredoxin